MSLATVLPCIAQRKLIVTRRSGSTLSSRICTSNRMARRNVRAGRSGASPSLSSPPIVWTVSLPHGESGQRQRSACAKRRILPRAADLSQHRRVSSFVFPSPSYFTVVAPLSSIGLTGSATVVVPVFSYNFILVQQLGGIPRASPGLDTD